LYEIILVVYYLEILLCFLVCFDLFYLLITKVVFLLSLLTVVETYTFRDNIKVEHECSC
jgi:hypothetical protein